jgi:hypothetical protein
VQGSSYWGRGERETSFYLLYRLGKGLYNI